MKIYHALVLLDLWDAYQSYLHDMFSLPNAGDIIRKNHIAIKGNDIVDVLAALKDWNIMDELHIINASNFFDRQAKVPMDCLIQHTFLHAFEDYAKANSSLLGIHCFPPLLCEWLINCKVVAWFNRMGFPRRCVHS